MTAPDVDPIREFAYALPAAVRAHLNRTQTIVALIHAAIRDQDWTPQQLAAECARDLVGATNPGAIITDRLRKATQRPPAVQPAPAFGPPIPFCSDDCRDNAGWVIDQDTGALIGRCPCRTRPTQEAIS